MCSFMVHCSVLENFWVHFQKYKLRMVVSFINFYEEVKEVPYFPAYNARVIYTKRIWNRKNEHARYTLERFPTNNARVICTKKGIGKYGIMY